MEPGQRDTSMVSYMRSYWTAGDDCSERGGCQKTLVFLKVWVRPVPGASLDRKRVGVLWKFPDGEAQTAEGGYFTTLPDGGEEWHVMVTLRSSDPGVLLIAPWYHDGLGNTYYDDNRGELHPVAFQGDFWVVRQDVTQTSIGISGGAVRGAISIFVADLDYAKDIELIWTADDWRTVNTWRMGQPGGKNGWYWVEKVYSGSERWQLDADLPGPVQRFQYAILYRQGVVNGASSYEFWDNNGYANYGISAPASPHPSPPAS